MTGNPNYLKHGIVMEYGGGHNLTGLYITEKKYFDKHPDFFPMKDGERVRPGSRRYRTQLCFTNPAMTKAFIAELDQRIRENPQFTTYRVMTNGLWDPSQGVERLRAEFLRRVYGAGADGVGEFYRLIEEAWFATGGTSRWNDRPSANWMKCVARKQLQAPCRAALQSAAPKVAHPNGRKMLAALRETFEEQVAPFVTMTLRGSAAKVAAPPTLDPEFQTADWAEAEPMYQFYDRLGTGPYDEKTVVRMLYDNDALYIGTKCFDRDVATLHSLAAGQPRDKWPVGDKFEIFLMGRNGDKSCYYQLVYDVNGNRFDARGRDVAWNGPWGLVTRTTGNGWCSLATVPWSVLGLDGAARPASVDALFLRYWNHNRKESKLGFWFAGSVHEPSTFCPIELR